MNTSQSYSGNHQPSSAESYIDPAHSARVISSKTKARIESRRTFTCEGCAMHSRSGCALAPLAAVAFLTPPRVSAEDEWLSSPLTSWNQAGMAIPDPPSDLPSSVDPM